MGNRTSGRWGSRGPVPVILAAGLIVALLAFAVAVGRDGAEDPPPPEDDVAEPLATERFRNNQGCYRFLHPPDWEVEAEGPATRIAGPEGIALITMAPSDPGPLRRASRRLVRSLRDGYDAVRVLERQPEEIGGRNARLVAGRARNQEGVRLRFLAIAIEGGARRNFDIVVLTPRDSDPLEVLPPVQEIIDSFRAGRGD